MLHNILEISSKISKNGKVPIKIALHKIHDDPEETNKNGIHWKREYVEIAMKNSGTIPICAEFIDTEKKDVPLGHGLTGEIENNGLREPIFETSEVTGAIEDYAIETIKDENGNDIDVVTGSGYIFSQRYPAFLKWVRENYALGKVCTSVEIMGLAENSNNIVYEEETPKEDFRTPYEYLYSGTVVLSLAPADDDAIILEISQKKEKKEEKSNMEFNMDELKTAVRSVVSELNEKSDAYETQIAELNSKITEKDALIEEKDNTISELNASVEDMQALLEKMKDDQKTYWEEREILEKEIAKAKVAEKLAELDSSLAEFNSEEKEVAKDDIEKLKENINACQKKEELNEVTSEINSIKSKICMAIVEKQKKAEADAKIAEQNSKKEKKYEIEDIFSEICTETIVEEDDDVNIF